jgi:capsular polysaccharide biosynthesis protein
MNSNRVSIFDGPLVLCKKRGTNNYGHFLIEMFTKAVLASRKITGAELSFLVSDEFGPLSKVMENAFEIAALGEKAVVNAGRDPIFVRELIVVDGLSQHGSFMSPLIMDCLDALATKVPAGDTKKIYVTRRGAQYRKARNEDLVVAHLEKQNFRVLDPGAMTLSEQISAFKGATTIVGISGAAMTNICFCPLGANVICLTPASMPDTFFWFIAGLRRLNYCEVRLPELGGAPDRWPTWCDDVLIDVKEVESLISIMEAAERGRITKRELEAMFIGSTYATSVFE